MTPEKLVASERQAWLDEERRASSMRVWPPDRRVACGMRWT